MSKKSTVAQTKGIEEINFQNSKLTEDKNFYNDSVFHLCISTN